jgi:hypothetical protein
MDVDRVAGVDVDQQVFALCSDVGGGGANESLRSGTDLGCRPSDIGDLVADQDGSGPVRGTDVAITFGHDPNLMEVR